MASQSAFCGWFSGFGAHRRLPAEYRQLEQRVDALKDVHVKLLKITKVYETEAVSGLCRCCVLFVQLGTTVSNPTANPSTTTPLTWLRT